jgi:sigma-B regulation protein RsbU (phosphoserine phosphatase)
MEEADHIEKEVRGTEKIFRRGGLAFRYARFLVLAFLVVFSIAFYYTFTNTEQILDQDVFQRARNITDLTISRIGNMIRPAEQVPYTLATALEASNPDYAMIANLSREFVLDDTVVFGSAIAFEPYMFDKKTYRHCMYYFEKSSFIQERNLNSEEYDYFNQDWYRIPKALGRPVWSEPYYDKGGGDTLMCTYSVPFYHWINDERKFAGVITMDISLKTFEYIVHMAMDDQSGKAYLVSEKGKLISPIIKDYMNQDIKKIILKSGDQMHDSIISQMLSGKRMFAKVSDIQHVKVPSWIYSAPVPRTKWVFALTFPTEKLYAGLYRFSQNLIVIFMISLLAMILITVMITRRFARPLGRLSMAAQRIGKGDFDTPLPEYKARDEISELTEAFAGMKKELVQYIDHLQVATAAREKMEGELKVAHDIQMGLLPKVFPARDDWDLAALLLPAKAVGGDLYDYFFLDDDHLVVAIGDVSGKGVPASLLMVSARALFRSKLSLKIPLNQSVYEINREICRENPNQMFVTFMAGIINLADGLMTYCNAGHNPSFLIRSGGLCEKLREVHGIPLGVFEHAAYSSGTVVIGPGESLLMYTDGVTEATSVNGDLLGEAAMLEILKGNTHLCPADTVRLLETRTLDFMAGAEQADDITLLILKSRKMAESKEAAENIRELRLQNQLKELDRIVALLELLGDEWTIPQRTVMELNLILEELFTNVVFYAYDDGQEHEILLTFNKLSASKLEITLEDDGREFNLLEKDTSENVTHGIEERKIGGLGIHFVKQLVDEIRYQRRDGKNIVILIRNF